MKGMSRIIADWTISDVKERKDYFDTQMKKHSVFREGNKQHQFNVCLKSFPEQHLLETTSLPSSKRDNLLKLDRPGGKEMYIEVLGYGASKTLLLWLQDLPSMHIFKQRNEGRCFIDMDISFPQSSKDETLFRYMAMELCESNGDATHYLSTLVHYYQQQTRIASSEVRTM